jgi:iron complex outermembrane receptor protein
LIVPRVLSNRIHGAVYGTELQADWKLARWWTVNSGYTWLKPLFHRTLSSQDNTTVAFYEGKDPRNRFTVRSSMNLPRRFELDQSIYYSGRLSLGPVPAYTRYDVRIGWRASESVEFSVAGQNLLQARHMEFAGVGDIYVPMPVKRGFYGKLVWHF